MWRGDVAGAEGVRVGMDLHQGERAAHPLQEGRPAVEVAQGFGNPIVGQGGEGVGVPADTGMAGGPVVPRQLEIGRAATLVVMGPVGDLRHLLGQAAGGGDFYLRIAGQEITRVPPGPRAG